MRISGGQTPYYKRLMVFVDGSNFLIELSKDLNIDFRADNPPLTSFALAKGLLDSISSRSDLKKFAGTGSVRTQAMKRLIYNYAPLSAITILSR